MGDLFIERFFTPWLEDVSREQALDGNRMEGSDGRKRKVFPLSVWITRRKSPMINTIRSFPALFVSRNRELRAASGSQADCVSSTQELERERERDS